METGGSATSHIPDALKAEAHRGDPFAAAVRATRMPMIITDPSQHDNPSVFVNNAFLKLTGYTRLEVIGRNCRFLQGPETDPAAVDPEEAFVAAVSSCHMLVFLLLAAQAGFEVRRYEDEAVGRMTKNARGALWVSHVELAPRVEYGEGGPPTAAEEADLHHRAHEGCYIANSVRTEITVRGVASPAA